MAGGNYLWLGCCQREDSAVLAVDTCRQCRRSVYEFIRVAGLEKRHDGGTGNDAMFQIVIGRWILDLTGAYGLYK